MKITNHTNIFTLDAVCLCRITHSSRATARATVLITSGEQASPPPLHFLPPPLGSPTVPFRCYGHLETFRIPQPTLAFHRAPTCRPLREPKRGCVAPPLPQRLFPTTARKTPLKSSRGNFGPPVYLQLLWRIIQRL